VEISPVAKYREPITFTDQQLKIFWLPEEIKVEKDIQDMLVNMTEAEKHGVITTLKLFTLYELKAGDEYWGGRFKRMFPQVEFIRMASAFSMFELCVHMPFYAKINELLHIHTDEFYDSYIEDETLKNRMEHIDAIIDSPDDLISLGGFSLVEGVILYSSFAFLKHFQSQGKNKLTNIVRGINFSVRDENIHSISGAWCFKLLKDKIKDKDRLAYIESKILETARKLYEHECRIVDMIFEEGKIDGITAIQLKHFIESRINNCLHALGYKRMFDVKWNPISDWFYDSINKYTYNDFFAGQGREYSRDWSEGAFTW
jgi:ribonucleotide reductase beta subunit family protein with ferritin-like domain